MIIDFSLRPPYASLTNMGVYKRQPEETFAAKIGLPTSEAATQKSMDLLIKEMDESDIVHGVCHGRATDGTKNEDLLELAKEYPGRFTGFAGIDISNISTAVEQTEHCLDDLGFMGVMLEPGNAVPPMYPDDRKLYPIYEICRRRGAHVLYTLSVWVGSDISYSRPVYVDRVAADFPDLKIIIRHACWPWVTEACGMALRRPNIYLIPDAYAVSMPGYQQWVEAANTYLADRLLFGTAFPIVPLKPIVDAFRRLPFNEGVRSRVEYQNAAALLNLPS